MCGIKDSITDSLHCSQVKVKAWGAPGVRAGTSQLQDQACMTSPPLGEARSSGLMFKYY